jgi:hypothetical protein
VLFFINYFPPLKELLFAKFAYAGVGNPRAKKY